MTRITMRTTTEDIARLLDPTEDETVHTLPYEELVADFRGALDEGDRWGSTMEPFFTVACELFWRGENIPADWVFRSGAANDPRDHEDQWFAVCEAADADQLVRFGNLLHRYSRRLKRAGLDY